MQKTFIRLFAVFYSFHAIFTGTLLAHGSLERLAPLSPGFQPGDHFAQAIQHLEKLKIQFRADKLFSWPLINAYLDQLVLNVPLTSSDFVTVRKHLFWWLYYASKTISKEQFSGVEKIILQKIGQLYARIPLKDYAPSPESIHIHLIDEEKRLWDHERETLIKEIKLSTDLIRTFLETKNVLKHSFFFCLGTGMDAAQIDALFEHLKEVHVTAFANGANKIVLNVQMDFDGYSGIKPSQYEMVLNLQRPSGIVPYSELLLSCMLSGNNFPVFGITNAGFSSVNPPLRTIWLEGKIQGQTPKTLLEKYLRSDKTPEEKRRYWKNIAHRITRTYFHFYVEQLEMASMIQDPTDANIMFNSVEDTLSDGAIAEAGQLNFEVDAGKISAIKTRANALEFIETNGLDIFRYMMAIYKLSIVSLQNTFSKEIGDLDTEVTFEEFYGWVQETIPDEPFIKLIFTALINKGLQHHLEGIWSDLAHIVQTPTFSPKRLNLTLEMYEKQLQFLDSMQSVLLYQFNDQMINLGSHLLNEGSFQKIQVDLKWLGRIDIESPSAYLFLIEFLGRAFKVEKSVLLHHVRELKRAA